MRVSARGVSFDDAFSAAWAKARDQFGWQDHTHNPCGTRCPHYHPPLFTRMARWVARRIPYRIRRWLP